MKHANLKAFKDQVIVITGAGSGLGLELAKELASIVEGLILLDIHPMSAEEQARHFGEFRSKVWWRTVDVRDWHAMQGIAQGHPFKRVDRVVANAGKGGLNPAHVFDPVTDMTIMSVNYFGTVNTFTAFLPQILKQKKGHFVGICSLAALRGLPNGASYSASKAAQLNFLESWRLDLRPFGIHVTSVLPGFIRTAMANHDEFSMPFMLDSRDCAIQILNAMAAQRKVVILPLLMGWLSRLNRVLPVWLYDILLPQLNGKKLKTEAKVF
jgi:short-subunit dehydrogenase